jgi:hypothetical protein
VAAARAAGCDRIPSEDLTDGEPYGSVTVVNPFRHDPGCGTERPARKGNLRSAAAGDDREVNSSVDLGGGRRQGPGRVTITSPLMPAVRLALKSPR